MNKIIILMFLSLLTCTKMFAQSDSLGVFRAPSKSNSTSRSAGGGKNSLSLSLAHLGRGGSIITYERLINNTPIAIFAGYGFTKIDYIGQFSFDEEDFYYASLYTEKTNVDLNRAVDFGIKYIFDEELGGTYFSLCYSSYINSITQKVDSYYELSSTSQSTYKLNYNSKEFKLVYGVMSESDSRFYNDFYFGAGFRMIEYQQLEINEVPVANTTGYYLSYDTELDITKDSFDEIKPWFFIGWKIGLRF